MSKANELLGDPQALAELGARLDPRVSLVDAVDAAGLFDAVDEPQRDRARRALHALAPSVGHALVSAAMSAATRGVPVVLQWKPGVAVELQVWESSNDDSSYVGLLLVSPSATDLAGTSA